MIPNEWEARHKLWEQASILLASEEDPWITSAILDLSWAERSILMIEKEVAEALGPFQVKAPVERSSQVREHLDKAPIFCECRAHSKLWIMGLYEVCRLIRKKRDPLKPLFDELEAARMPFAKHEVRKKEEKYFPELCFPLWGNELGWMVKDYKHQNIPKGEAFARTHANFYVSRRNFADRFLRVSETYLQKT